MPAKKTNPQEPLPSRTWNREDKIQYGLFRSAVIEQLGEHGHFSDLYENGMISQIAIDREVDAFIDYFFLLFDDSEIENVVDAREKVAQAMPNYQGIPDPVTLDTVAVHLTFPFGKATLTLAAGGKLNGEMEQAYSFLIGKIAASYDKIQKSQNRLPGNSQTMETQPSGLPEVKGGFPSSAPSPVSPFTTSATGQTEPVWEEIPVDFVAVDVEWKNNKRYLNLVIKPHPRIPFKPAIYPDKVKSNRQVNWDTLPLGTNPASGFATVLMKDGKIKGVKELTFT